MTSVTSETPDQKVVVIEGPGRLVANVSEDFRKRINGLVDQGNARLVIDLRKTEFMDSTGLGADAHGH